MVKIAEKEQEANTQSQKKEKKKKPKVKPKKKWKIDGFILMLYLITGFNFKEKKFTKSKSNIITFYSLYCRNCGTYSTTTDPNELCPECQEPTIFIFSNKMPRSLYEQMEKEKEEQNLNAKLTQKLEKELEQTKKEADKQFKEKIKGLKDKCKEVKKSFKKNKKNKEGSG